MPQLPPEKPDQRPAVDPHIRQLERVERLSEFGSQMAAALRGEFVYFWDRADRRAEVPEAEAFVHRVDTLRNLTARYLREAARCRHMQPVQALHVLRTLDLGELLEAGRGLEASGRLLRDRAREHGWSQGRLGSSSRAGALPWTDPEGWTRLFAGMPVAKEAPAEKSKGGWLTGRLQAMVELITVTPLGQEKREGPPATPPPGVRRLQAFENALGLVEEVVAESGPRIAALRQAVADSGADGRPSGTAPLRLIRVPLELRPLVPGAAAAIKASPPLLRAAVIALGQWDQANRQMAEFQNGRDAARKVPSEQVGEVLRPYQIDKLKGLIMPLTNLHMTFRGAPGILALFPPPVARRIEAQVPTSEVSHATTELIEAEIETVVVEAVKAPNPKLSAEETSRRRLGLIMTYLTDPTGTPELSDERLVYRLVAEEHAYQEDRVVDLGMRLRLLPREEQEGQADDVQARREALQAALDEARQNKAHLQELLGMVAGSAGET